MASYQVRDGLNRVQVAVQSLEYDVVIFAGETFTTTDALVEAALDAQPQLVRLFDPAPSKDVGGRTDEGDADDDADGEGPE